MLPPSYMMLSSSYILVPSSTPSDRMQNTESTRRRLPELEVARSSHAVGPRLLLARPRLLLDRPRPFASTTSGSGTLQRFRSENIRQMCGQRMVGFGLQLLEFPFQSRGLDITGIGNRLRYRVRTFLFILILRWPNY